MRDGNYQIAICGTFDVENYGDLLFPLIAEAELTRRLGPITLHRFSYHSRVCPEWPYAVTSLTELPALAGSLDGMLIGGGFIVRFDKEVAPGYGPPITEIHHPTGYWLTPALIALQHGIPLVWNAPGMHCNDIPAWAEPLVELALAHSRYISVRDTPSQATLAQFVDKSRVAVLPDTAFGITRLIDARQPSVELKRVREQAGLTGPYIVVQATLGLDRVVHFIKNHFEWLRNFHFLILPVGPVLGDSATFMDADLPGSVRLSFWPHPLLLAELISQADAVIGHSYHLAITALACGVPVFTSADLSSGKYTALADWETIFPLPKETAIDPHWFITRLGKKRPSSTAQSALDPLAQHWDRVAAIIQAGPAATQPALNRFWQSLPHLLEAASDRNTALVAECMEQQRRIDELGEHLNRAQAKITSPQSFHSAKVGTPLHFIARGLKYLTGK
jgi:lipopolysaccharide transport system ATP-binding protein